MPPNDAGDADDRRLDGNALTGALLELFAVDLVPAECTCAHCGRTGPLAQHDLYADSPALVLRCVGCAGVVLRYSSAGGQDPARSERYAAARAAASGAGRCRGMTRGDD